MACKSLLKTRELYIAEQSFETSAGRFILKDKNGAQIDIARASPAPLILAAREDLRMDSDGSIVFRQVIYTAVRHLSSTKAALPTLAASRPGPRYADAQVATAMLSSDAASVQPAVVYNAMFSPTVPNTTADILDGAESTVSFFIGAPKPRNYPETLCHQSQIVRPKV